MAASGVVVKSEYPASLIGFFGPPLVMVILAPWWLSALTSPQSYYDFADQRILLGVPSFWNVVSNLPFALIGWLGLRAAGDWAWRVLFAGVFLTAFGSAWFHLAPSDATLVWDRLPMTLDFVAILANAMG